MGHLKALAGGLGTLLDNERIFSFEFPERPGALLKFLELICPRFDITLFHYRNEGSRSAFCLIGLGIDGAADMDELDVMTASLGSAYAFREESGHGLLEVFGRSS